MITAIYARKPTEQTGVADDQKSVARQIDHARQYAERKGWAVADEYVFVDDGISGAEFTNRPGFLRLMNALKPRPAFQALVMSEESRLGREAIGTAYALKELVQAGVRVFFYMEDRERTLDSPTDKIMLSLTTFGGPSAPTRPMCRWKTPTTDPRLFASESHLFRLASCPPLAAFCPRRFRSTGPRVAVSACPTALGRQRQSCSAAQPEPSGLSTASVRVVFALRDAAHRELVNRPVEEISVLPLPEVRAGEGWKAESRRDVYRPALPAAA